MSNGMNSEELIQMNHDVIAGRTFEEGGYPEEYYEFWQELVSNFEGMKSMGAIPQVPWEWPEDFEPTSPEEIVRRRTEREVLNKARVYLRPDEPPPPGVNIQQGPRGGRYYDSGISSSPAITQFLTPSTERAFDGKPRPNHHKWPPMSKLETGALGEKIAIEYSRANGKNAVPMNSDQNNYAVDLMDDDGVIEVKTGITWNSPSARQWRATIGQPGKKESEWLKTASEEDKRAWNIEKQRMILERKEQARREVEQEIGRPVAAKTLTMIIDPDRKLVDIFEFDGFHLRIGWNSEAARYGYKGSYSYA